MSTRVIHIQTQVSTVFGILDEDGNVTEQITAQATIQTLSDDAFTTVAAQLRSKRDEIADVN
jgi:hypothetical protein